MNLFERIFTSDRAAFPAILFKQREISYAELRDETVRVAEILHALGVQRGDRVSLLLTDSPEFIVSFVAIISTGAIAVPINLALRREEQLFILKDCGACVAIVEAQAAPSLFANSPMPDLKNLIIVRRNVESASPAITGHNTVDFASAERLRLDKFLATGQEGALPDGRASDTETDAFILYTSGSTGE